MLREWVKHRYGVFDETGFDSDRQYPLWTSEYGSHPPPSSFSSKLAASHLQENSCTTTFANNTTTTRYLFIYDLFTCLEPAEKDLYIFLCSPWWWWLGGHPLKESSNMLCVFLYPMVVKIKEEEPPLRVRNTFFPFINRINFFLSFCFVVCVCNSLRAVFLTRPKQQRKNERQVVTHKKFGGKYHR